MEKLHNLINSKKIVGILLVFILLQGCKTEKKNSIKEIKKEDVIEITTNVMDFQSVDTISSGWTTFKYINNSNEPHFFLLEKYPANKSIDDGRIEVFPVFQNGMDLINEGKLEEALKEFGNLPEWYSEIIFSGGSGLVSPKESAITTLKMQPGYYVMECYVKMDNGKFHSVMGMSKSIVVTNTKSVNSEPSENFSISISSSNGITYDETKLPLKGARSFSVNFVDQIVHENFVGHDINLVKYEDGIDLRVLEKWMNWADSKGLISPAPEGITFLGGVNDMPAGSIGYFQVNLEPGNYALISEVPNTISKNMLKTFKITE